MNIRRIAVLGSGNGGLAAAGDLAMRGFEINLFELPEFEKSLAPIILHKRVKLFDAITGEGKLAYIGTDIDEATKKVDLIMVVTPAIGHKRIAGLLASHVTEGQIVYVNPGSTLGALEFWKIFKEMGIKGIIPIVETSTLSYGARRIGENEVSIKVASKRVLQGVFPAKDTLEITKILKNVYPENEPAQNVLETSLNNLNPSIHPPATLLTASTIENKGKFSIYKEGVSPSVAKVIEAVDNERLALCRELGFKEWPLRDQTAAHGYSPPGKDLYHTLHSERFESITDNMSLQHRFLLEDVQYGLVSFASLGEQIGVPMPTSRAIIELTSKLHGVDYWKKGTRTLEYLGLRGMNKESLLKFLYNGS